MRRTAWIAAAAVTTFAMAALLLGGWFLLAAGAAGEVRCEPTTPLDNRTVPRALVPIFSAAAAKYELGAEGPAILAGLTKVESDFGRNQGPSSAGAVGWTQFMPETWQAFGVDADGDGRRDPHNAADAIFSAARYLRSLGAPGDWHRAIFGYNHAEWYVRQVLDTARDLAAAGPSKAEEPVSTCQVTGASPIVGRGHRVYGGGRLVSIPGEPGMTIDERNLPDLLALRDRYHFKVTAGYAPTGHAVDGEHPLALAVDLVPGAGSTWDDIDALAHWAEPVQGKPRAPFRWVGYDGDPHHGRGDHLHLSWAHAPAAAGARPVAWVQVLIGVAR